MKNTRTSKRLIFIVLSGIAILFCLFASVINKHNHAKISKWHSRAEPSLNFIVLGDWGKRGSHSQRSVAKQMGHYAKKYQTDFILSTGDNFYLHGIQSTKDPKLVKAFENVYTAPSLMIPWYITLGNHDYVGNIQAQIDYSQINERWHLPARYYFIDKKIDAQSSVRFIFLDTNPFIKLYHERDDFKKNLMGQDIQKQLKWFEETLAKSNAQWNIVVGHHPIYSSGPKYGNTPELIKHVKPILEKYSVQVYLCGHEHNLQHLNPDKNIHYFVSGTGTKYRKDGSNKGALFAKGIFGFLAITLRTDEMRAEFINHKGHLLYSTIINLKRWSPAQKKAVESPPLKPEYIT